MCHAHVVFSPKELVYRDLYLMQDKDESALGDLVF
jgi:hypothetical protein